MTAHQVPIHLNQPDGIGRFSLRQIFLCGAALFYVAPQAWAMAPANGPALGDGVRALYPGLGWVFQEGSIPLFPLLYATIACVPFFIMAMPLDPPVEHGLMTAIAWVFKHGYINLDAMQHVLGRVTVKGNRFQTDFGIGGMWEMPGVNMRLSDVASVEVLEELWGELLNGLTAPVQTITTASPVNAALSVGRIETYAPGKRALHTILNGRAATLKGTGQLRPEEHAKRIGKWLREDVKGRNLVERRHFLVISGSDEQTFTDSELELTDAITALGFRDDQIRRLKDQELRDVIQRTWSMGAAPTRGQLGPSDKTFVSADSIRMDDEWHIVLAFGKWMRIARDNAMAPLIDGAYSVDVIQHIAPVEADDILEGLERRADALRWGGRRRRRAVKDLDKFVGELRDGVESPFDVSILLHIKGPDKHLVKQEAKRVIKRVRRSGARCNSLRWEQTNAMLAVAPLATSQLKRRTKRVDTSSATHLYPWSASSMWMEDAVPWGETLGSRRPVGINVWRRPMIPNPHVVVYMLSGGGKGFGWKVEASRELFSGLTQEFFGFDQATEDLTLGEYGKWAAYCGIDYRYVKDEADFGPALADLDNYRWLGPGIEWNIAQLPIPLRPMFVAKVKEALWRRASALPARRRWAIDELWSIVKLSADLGVDPHWLAECISAIEDLIRTGRRMQIGGVFMTQAAKDSLEVPIMGIIQSQAATQIYGMQNPSEITDIAPRLHWSAADIAQIKKLAPGQQIISAGPWRVAMRVTSSDEEYEMANTDGKPSLEEVQPSTSAERNDDTP